MKSYYKILSLLLIVFSSACQTESAYQSVAEEVFPPVVINDAALFRMGGLALNNSYFNNHWTLVTFGSSPCKGKCMDRISKLETVDGVNKLFVFDGLAGHEELNRLTSKFSSVQITMGTTAPTFDKFYRYFDVDFIIEEEKHDFFYLVNKSAGLEFVLSDDVKSLQAEMNLLN